MLVVWLISQIAIAMFVLMNASKFLKVRKLLQEMYSHITGHLLLYRIIYSTRYYISISY